MNFIKRVYTVQDGGDYAVRIEAKNTDSCLCVCNGQIEADTVMAMVMACGRNTYSQSAHAKAVRKLEEFVA